MSTAGMIKVSAGCPTFDGTDYPYWKNKMRMHLEAIDNDLWYVVENGVPSVTPSLNAADVKRFKQLDSQAKNIICGHLSKGQYGRVSALETAKLIWDRLSKVKKESQHSVTLELMFFAISSTASKDSTMKMFSKPSIASLTSQMSFKHLVPLTSPTMRW